MINPQIQDIMTQDIKYYEDFENDRKAKKFCKERDIDFLPLKSTLQVWHYNQKFLEIEPEQFIDKEIFVFDPKLQNTFAKYHILFVKGDAETIIGVVHFSDYRNITVYTYLYYLMYKIEDQLRSQWQERAKNIKKLKEELQRDKNVLLHKSLSILIDEVDTENPWAKRHKLQLLSLRNRVFHINEMSKDSSSVYDLVYSYDSFAKEFFEPSCLVLAYINPLPNNDSNI